MWELCGLEGDDAQHPEMPAVSLACLPVRLQAGCFSGRCDPSFKYVLSMISGKVAGLEVLDCSIMAVLRLMGWGHAKRNLETKHP